MLLGTSWRAFTAVEQYEVGRIGFTWRARFPIAPLTWLDVVDEYRGGAGRLEGRLWGGLRIMRSTGHDTDVGQALRYLSELVWNHLQSRARMGRVGRRVCRGGDRGGVLACRRRTALR
jgi:hypothetical protein